MTTSKSTLNTAPDPASGERLHVVAAVIRDDAGRLLIAKRPERLHQGGLWEFPGGKVETDEPVSRALIRELQEELGITAERFRPLIRIPYDYSDRKVLLDIWLVTGFSGAAHGAEGQEIRWIESGDLHHYRFPAANAPIITAALLPHDYLITPDPGEETQWSGFLTGLEASLNGGIELVQFRAKSLTSDAYQALAVDVITLCHKKGARVLLNCSPDIAKRLNADGLHLSSSRLSALKSRPLPADKLVAASCHSQDEIDRAAALHCDFAVLGPVKQTASHPGKKGIGWEAFQQVTEKAAFPVYALGGMSVDDRQAAWQHGAQGIAAIRAIWGGKA